MHMHDPDIQSFEMELYNTPTTIIPYYPLVAIKLQVLLTCVW